MTPVAETKTSVGLKAKLLVSMMIAGILPLFMGMILSYIQGNKSIRNIIGSNFETLARETANKVDFAVDREISKNRQTALRPDLIRWVEQQTAAFKEADPAKIESGFIGSSLESKEATIQSVIENSGTEALVSFLTEANSESTRALFVTDTKGILIASVNNYPPIVDNRGGVMEKVLERGVYLSNIYRDKKLDDYVFELVLPIFSERKKDVEDVEPQDRKPLGLLHRVYSAKEYFAIVLESIRFGDTGHVMLIDGKGVVIDCPILPTGFQIPEKQVVQAVTLPATGWVVTQGNGHGSNEESIIGFSPLFKSDVLLEDSSGVHWHMFAWQASEELFAPTRKLLVWNSTAAVFGVVLIILIGTYAANKIIRPVRKLQTALASIGQSSATDNPDNIPKAEEVRVDANDEIGELAKAFNKMSQDLKTIRVSELKHLSEMEELLMNLAESETRITTVMNNVVDGIITIDDHGIIESFNPAAERIFGYKADEVKGKNVSLLMPEPDKSKHDEYLKNYLKTGEAKIIGFGREVVAQRKDGSTFHMDLAVGEMTLGGRRLFVGVMRDITQRISMERDLRKLSRAVEQSPSSVMITDAMGNIEYVNPNFVETSGYSYEEALGKKPSILKSGVHPPKFYQILWETILSGKEWRKEFCNRKKNGELYWELQSISPLRDADGNITHFLALKIDDTERKRAEEKLKVYTSKLERSNTIKDSLIEELQELKKKLEVSAKTDPLTGLANRRGMIEKVEYERFRFNRNKKAFAFVISDIDHFKKVNDTYGHDAGDFVLRHVAHHFKDFSRKQDVVCRWGGEEFLMLLPETDLNGAILLAEKFRARIEKEAFEHNGQVLRITMSFGLSIFEESDQDIDACIKRADKCLYIAKVSGRNRIISTINTPTSSESPEKRKTQA